MESEPATTDPPASPPADSRAVLEFMSRLGQAYLGCGEQTAQIELNLRRIASAYRMRRSRVVAFSTAIFVSVHDDKDEHVTLAEGPGQIVRLDQIADIYKLGDEAREGTLPPRAGIKRLAEILQHPAQFGLLGGVVGHAILTVGLAIILMPEWTNLVSALVLGSIVGALKAFNRNRPILAAPLAVVAAGLVSALVFLAVKFALPVDPRHALVPPLVTFLPGAMLTFGMVELAYGDMVSGSSRLITGLVQLVLIAFGLAVGALLVGYSPENLLDAAAVHDPAELWAPWAGVIVFGIGVYLHHSAPRNSLGWMLVCLMAAFAAQRFAAGRFGAEISGFFGTLVATPLGYLIQHRFKGPPSMVTFLPSFWLLVPGSLGLLSVARMLSDRAAGLDGLVTAVFAFASIALGTLVGASVYKWLTETFGWWGLKIGRAGRYFRRRK